MRFSADNRMARAVDECEAMGIRLAEEEKLGSLGRLSSAIAHEINDPLGGLFRALDALKRHGDKERVRQTSISLLERGLQGIRDVVRSALHIYRTDEARRSLGLWMVRRLIDECDGTITVEAAEGRGTRISVFLPTVPAERVRDVA